MLVAPDDTTTALAPEERQLFSPIEQVSILVFNLKSVQQSDIFFLKRSTRMMLLLVQNIFHRGRWAR